MSMKNRAFARLTAEEGKIVLLGDCARSATNSTRMSDSVSFVDAGDGCSAGTIGPPYAIAGTFRRP
jgi:hypothetical protein